MEADLGSSAPKTYRFTSLKECVESDADLSLKFAYVAREVSSKIENGCATSVARTGSRPPDGVFMAGTDIVLFDVVLVVASIAECCGGATLDDATLCLSIGKELHNPEGLFKWVGGCDVHKMRDFIDSQRQNLSDAPFHKPSSLSFLRLYDALNDDDSAGWLAALFGFLVCNVSERDCDGVTGVLGSKYLTMLVNFVETEEQEQIEQLVGKEHSLTDHLPTREQSTRTVALNNSHFPTSGTESAETSTPPRQASC